MIYQYQNNVGVCAIIFIENDGGRRDAGFIGDTGDCVTRAIAIATGTPYAEVYAALAALSGNERKSKRRKRKSHPRTGVRRVIYDKYLASLGWRFVPTMTIGSGCKVHLRADELPHGRIIVRLSGHLSAVINGDVHDTYDPSRDGTRCVYGYYTNAEV